jgi:hypothetical protein
MMLQVTEAISKGIPVVAYNAGGIPFQVSKVLHGAMQGTVCVAVSIACRPLTFSVCLLLWQIRHGETGYLVDVGETTTVAKHLFNLCTDKVRRPTIHRMFI